MPPNTAARRPSALAAHRAVIEETYCRGNPDRVRLLREAAAEFDAALAKTREDAKRRGRPRKSA